MAGRAAKTKAKPKAAAAKAKGPLGMDLAGKTWEQKQATLRWVPSLCFQFLFHFFLLFTPVWQGSELKKEINAINGMLLDLGDEERVKDGVSELKTLMANVVSLHGRPALSFELFLPFCY